MSLVRRSLAALAIARQADIDEPTLRLYAQMLAGCDEQDVATACGVVARQPRREYETALPAVGDLLVSVEQVKAERLEQAQRAKLLPKPAAKDDEPTYFCVDCYDEPSGWRSWRCGGPSAYGLLSRSCGRTKAHGPHDWVSRCACVERNPVIAEHRSRMAAARVRREEGRRR